MRIYFALIEMFHSKYEIQFMYGLIGSFSAPLSPFNFILSLPIVAWNFNIHVFHSQFSLKGMYEVFNHWFSSELRIYFIFHLNFYSLFYFSHIFNLILTWVWAFFAKSLSDCVFFEKTEFLCVFLEFSINVRVAISY